jgi:hypothetical protein
MGRSSVDHADAREPSAGPIGKPRCFCPIVPFDIEGIRKFGKSDRGFLAIGLAISIRDF